MLCKTKKPQKTYTCKNVLKKKFLRTRKRRGRIFERLPRSSSPPLPPPRVLHCPTRFAPLYSCTTRCFTLNNIFSRRSDKPCDFLFTRRTKTTVSGLFDNYRTDTCLRTNATHLVKTGTTIWFHKNRIIFYFFFFRIRRRIAAVLTVQLTRNIKSVPVRVYCKNQLRHRAEIMVTIPLFVPIGTTITTP